MSNGSFLHACLWCLLGTGVKRHMHQRGQVRKVRVYRGQALVSRFIDNVFVSPARASRALAEAAISVTSPVCRPASLFEGLAPARVTERVRLPLVIRPGVDKPVHGQMISITR